MEPEDIYPPRIEINMVLKKVRVFVGDRWQDIGNIELVTHRNGCLIEVQLPDVEKFLCELEYADDGGLEWSEWGPRLN